MTVICSLFRVPTQSWIWDKMPHTLSHRAVASPGFRWLPGMLWAVSRVAPLEDYTGRIVEGARRTPSGPGLPDLTDPATLGCLLALVREAWSDPYLCAVGDSDTGWRVDAVTAQVQDLHSYPSEAEALVAALESAP